ncbi:hypothetical protein SAMN04489713_10936 [Actinomadura madurae]|uniref:Uncharacterized protein n=1 Tax=Actinomadura madurae TaxID=1993 RepID=A0A1I5JLT5_9ACTN|nr:hypothetical protein SAMN04489713_10936 [Actinomadura madurae]
MFAIMSRSYDAASGNSDRFWLGQHRARATEAGTQIGSTMGVVRAKKTAMC